jgi:hypothetical protein
VLKYKLKASAQSHIRLFVPLLDAAGAKNPSGGHFQIPIGIFDRPYLGNSVLKMFKKL